MKSSIEELIRGKVVIAYGAGEYFDRAMPGEGLNIDYFLGDAAVDSEKNGRPVRAVSSLAEESREVVIIIFERQVGEAILELATYGYHWQQQVFDCRYFGLMTYYADEYHYFETFEDLCNSELLDVAYGFNADIEMNQILVPVRRPADKIRIRVGSGGRLKMNQCVLRERSELNVGSEGEIDIGSRSTIEEGVKLSAAAHSQISLGSQTLISHSSVVSAANYVSIQSREKCSFGWHLNLYAYAPIFLGNDIMASSYIYIGSGAGHDLCIDGQRRFPQELHIGDHVWLGLRSTILPGSKLGDGCMVGASSVVNKEFGSRQLIAGNPARAVKENITWDRDYSAYKEQYHTAR